LENACPKTRAACFRVLLIVRTFADETVADHFADAGKMVKLGFGAGCQIEHVMLTRYTCCLVVQNGAPRKLCGNLYRVLRKW